MAQALARTERLAAGGTVDRALDRLVNAGKPLSANSQTENSENAVYTTAAKNHSHV